MKELRLMKGNEAIAEAAMRCGVDAFFGYPITPQTEIMEHLMLEKADEKMGMVVLQTESEIAAISAVYGAGGCGKKAMTTSSSPGISLMQEGISYIAGAEVPCLLVNVVRGGPGLGTIQPSQADYFQSVKGGGHGDYHLVVLAPNSVQEMADFVSLGFEIAFRYRNPVMILSDGVIGQMMEKVELAPYIARWTDEEIKQNFSSWATVGKTADRKTNVISSLKLHPEQQEAHNEKLQRKYREIEKNEVRYETYNCEDADYLLVAYGSSSRICQKAMHLGRKKGYKVGVLRPITLYPFPSQIIETLADQVKGILSVEMSAGQMVEDVRLAAKFKTKVEHYGRFGGMISTPDEILAELEKKIIH